MVTVWYPCDQAKNVIEATKKAPKLPDYIKKWLLYGTPDGNNGYKVYNLIYVKEGISDEAVIFIGKMQQYFIENINGYHWKAELVLGMKDSMKLFL